MTNKETAWISIISLIVLAIAFWTVWYWRDDDTTGKTNAVSALALITFTAVAIERVIEVGWTTLGSFIGSFWPLSGVKRRVDSLVAGLDQTLAPVITDAQAALANAQAAGQMTAHQATAMQANLAELEDQITELQAQGASKQNARSIVRAANDLVKTAQDTLGSATPAINAANSAISNLNTFVESFNDNPGRRLISIYAGMILGLAVAGLFELNLFQAASEDASVGGGHLVALTGIVIGLGSSPTHEVIRAIQEYKEDRKASSGSA